MPVLQSSSIEIGQRFRQLQAQLRDRWQPTERFDVGHPELVIVPSISLDPHEIEQTLGFHYYEERLLCYLGYLHHSPHPRIVYVTSYPLPSTVIDYYSHLVHPHAFLQRRGGQTGFGIDSAQPLWQTRLHLLTLNDPSPRSLTQKILDRPTFIDQMRQGIHLENACMICYNATPLERDLSVRLSIPLLATDPDLAYWGTKSGSRQIFAECGIAHPDGSELVWTVEELAVAAAELWERHPRLTAMVIKLNEGVSGSGNALLHLQDIQYGAPGNASHADRVAILHDQFANLRFQADSETWSSFAMRIPIVGCIVEAFIDGEEKRSPSVQGLITPLHTVQILSTHEQILGGTDTQIYLGCCFPADLAYSRQLQDLGRSIGENLARKGALGFFSVDFIGVRQSMLDCSEFKWDLQAVEINLRKGGTTHPQMLLQFLTHGCYDESRGLFYDQHGQAKYYMSTDDLQNDAYRGLYPGDLLQIISDHQLQFDHETNTGIFCHLMSTLPEFGKLGVTCIGNSIPEAQRMSDRLIEILDQTTAS